MDYITYFIIFYIIITEFGERLRDYVERNLDN